ncbi:hypothetical protein I302_100714 [Kwoniella bestiolae CBS 10118]|uniref:Uncharacterized protein n=1 Tax=Kwoniella bestiolae CBS 10118 TaxID=1296100 RepID=A0A1B9G5U9_9TREE|nr:hypothetical protein I302_04089 [Kwoniella bestiolae CBS 10118]OCF26405.1 hypothetical protein I302_04089 [Kwoniella bestiolae CBS 10118]
MASFTGALGSKRKSDLAEIAESLGISDPEARVADLVKNIQAHLDRNESVLSKDARYKGLYYKKRASGTHPPDSDSESPTITAADVKAQIVSTAKSSRKSINKAVDKVQATIDAANVPLPESPIALSKIQDKAIEVSQALVPSTEVQRGLTTQFHTVSNQLIKYTKDGQLRVDHAVRHLRDLLSTPQHLVLTSLSIELLFLLSHVVQFYDHTYYFPPSAGAERGTIASLLNVFLFWVPNATLKFRLPEIRAFGLTDVWSAVAWWFFSTVLPPYALSTVVSFVPQKGTARHTGAQTRYQSSHPPTPTSDPLAFTLIRLALLILPLTSAAPSAFVDALEISGNLQGRALAAGLTAALVLAEKLY